MEMNTATAIRHAQGRHLACFSFRGHDFDVAMKNRRHIKKVTNRARRALDKALTNQEV